MLRDTVVSCIIAFLASLFCIKLMLPIAVKVGLVDRPNQRKLHQREVPLIGGIVIFFGFCFALLHLHVSLQPYRGLLSGGVLLVLMGVVDDFKDLSARLRLLGQIVVALMLTSWTGLIIQNLGDLLWLGPISLNLWALPFTVLVVVTQMNATNMIDGQDGLAGGVALSQLIWLWVYADKLSLSVLQMILAILAVLLLVFLSFNLRMPWRKHVAMFLGDAGSTFLAFVLTWAAIQISQTNQQVVRPIDVLWVMALPLFDLINVMFYRVRQGKSVMHAGRDHAHHALINIGLSGTQTTLAMVVLSSSLGAIGYALAELKISEGISFIVFISILVVYLYFFAFARQAANQNVLRKAVSHQAKTSVNL